MHGNWNREHVHLREIQVLSEFEKGRLAGREELEPLLEKAIGAYHSVHADYWDGQSIHQRVNLEDCTDELCAAAIRALKQKESKT